MNEQQKFLEDLGHDQNRDVDVLDQPIGADPAKDDAVGATGATGSTGGEGEGDGGDVIAGIRPRNRKERRRLERLVADRESSIFLAGKLEARTEAKTAVTEEADYLKAVERIYGTDTPEAQLATDLLKKGLEGSGKAAEERAYQRIKEEIRLEKEAEASAQKEVDGILEDIEDTYNVNLTEPQEQSFLQMLQKMSPKDESGRVIKLADPHAVWEVFQERLSKRGTDSRAKTLSSRSMVQSGASKESTLTDDANARFLQDNGII